MLVEVLLWIEVVVAVAVCSLLVAVLLEVVVVVEIEIEVVEGLLWIEVVVVFVVCSLLVAVSLEVVVVEVVMLVRWYSLMEMVLQQYLSSSLLRWKICTCIHLMSIYIYIKWTCVSVNKYTTKEEGKTFKKRICCNVTTILSSRLLRLYRWFDVLFTCGPL